MATKKSKTVRVSEEELAALKAYRESQSNSVAGKESEVAAAVSSTTTTAQQALADAFVSAIERTRPPSKKTVADRVKKTPWSPPKGTPELKLKRKMYHHGIPITGRVTNDEIALMNQIRPGAYCDNFVRVTVRKDRGLDISYPVRTASQRLKMVNQFGVRSFKELLERLIDEKSNPTKYRRSDDFDIYESA